MDWGTQQKFFGSQFWRLEVHDKVAGSCCSGFSWGPSLGLQVFALFLCPHVVLSLPVGVFLWCVFISLCRHQSHWIMTPPWWSYFTLITFLKVLSQNTVTSRVRILRNKLGKGVLGNSALNIFYTEHEQHYSGQGRNSSYPMSVFVEEEKKIKKKKICIANHKPVLWQRTKESKVYSFEEVALTLLGGREGLPEEMRLELRREKGAGGNWAGRGHGSKEAE